jgi:uncharacterized protein YidB (DUF937 family)
MGLLDMAMGMLGGGLQDQQGEPKAMLLQSVLGMLSGNSQGGGLQGLLNSFQNAGLGDVIGSWIGTGQNLPISGDQIQQALGEGRLDQIAATAGLSRESVADHLATLLPGVIDQLTPNGEMPQEGMENETGLLGMLMSKLQ